MKKELAKNFSQFQGLNPDLVDPEEEPKEDVIQDTELSAILNEIFSVDPVTGFPRGDIACYLSKDGNPTVKAWLETNLLMPRKSSGSSMEGLTDDLIEEMSRRADESIDDYSVRIRGIYDDALQLIESSKTE